MQQSCLARVFSCQYIIEGEARTSVQWRVGSQSDMKAIWALRTLVISSLCRTQYHLKPGTLMRLFRLWDKRHHPVRVFFINHFSWKHIFTTEYFLYFRKSNSICLKSFLDTYNETIITPVLPRVVKDTNRENKRLFLSANVRNFKLTELFHSLTKKFSWIPHRLNNKKMEICRQASK